ncbi:MAG TPA: Rieske 2Fe-2S domain-containing protein [Candidatus Binatia bacterium]|nr:Rieske 2Fe-2S domain-containing protein [Candidatus Binatia bacterium]
MAAVDIAEIAPDVPAGLESGLRNYWYPILLSEDLTQGSPVAIHCLGESLVVWRDAEGHPGVLFDRCPHRAAKLSAGRVLEGQLQCAFHGLRFDKTGECTLIPWEPEESPSRKEVYVQSYPAKELGGYIWAYLGDATRFAPPPLEQEVPQEILSEDEYRSFRMPTEIWDANWLLTVDGGDGFHAVTLHSDTQAVEDKRWQGGNVQRASASLAERRVKIVETTYGVRGIAVDRQGKPIHHGHLLEVKGDRFILPCITTNVIRPVPGAEPYVARLWQFPVDQNRTLVQRFVVQRVTGPEAQQRWEKLFHDVVRPRLEGISREDAMIANAQGNLVTARNHEHLFEPDKSMYEVRQRLKKAFLAQREQTRIAPSQESLVWPVASPPAAA